MGPLWFGAPMKARILFLLQGKILIVFPVSGLL